MTREHLLDQVARQGLFTDGLFCQSEPELAGLKSHVLIWVLGPLQHVLVTEEQVMRRRRRKKNKDMLSVLGRVCYTHLDNTVHMWDEAVNADFQKHDQSPAHILPYFTVLVTSQCKETLENKRGQKEHIIVMWLEITAATLKVGKLQKKLQHNPVILTSMKVSMLSIRA